MLGTLTRPAEEAGAAAAEAQVPSVGFTRASRRRREPIFSATDQLGANTIAHNSIEVPASGFLRSLLVLVTFAGGSGGSAAAAADAPWNVLQSIEFSDINGSPIIAPMTGYELFVLNKYGSPKWKGDPKAWRSFTALDANGNGQFLLRIPLEIALRDALGSLPNQNASQTFRFSYTVNTSAQVFTTPPVTTVPTCQVQVWTESWAAPAPVDAMGARQEQVPPDVGVVQFASKQVVNVAATGEQTIRHSRVGQAIRALIYIGRTAAGVRSATVFPSIPRLSLDTTPIDNVPQTILQSAMAEAYGYNGADDGEDGLDTGVFVFPFHDDLDGHPGEEMRDSWLPTTGATRLELTGSFAATGTLTILTVDVGRPG